MSGKQRVVGISLWMAAIAIAFFLGASIQRVKPPSPAYAFGDGFHKELRRQQILRGEEMGSLLSAPVSIRQRARLDLLLAEMDWSEVEWQLKLRHAEPPSPARNRLLQLLWGRLGELDPVRALARAGTSAPPGERRAARESVVQAWNAADPAAASRWIFRNIEEVALRSAWISDSLAQLGDRGEIDAMLSLLSQLSEGREKTTALATVAGRLAQNEPGRFAAWFESLSELRDRQAAISGFAGSWAPEDPAGALEWVFSLDPRERASAAEMIVHDWLRWGGLGEALAWQTERADPAVQDDVRGFIVRTLAEHDADGALELLDGIASERKRSTSLALMISLTPGDPLRFRAGIERLPAGPVRDSAVRALARRLLQEAPGEAESFLAQTPVLSEELRLRFQQELSDARRLMAGPQAIPVQF